MVHEVELEVAVHERERALPPRTIVQGATPRRRVNPLRRLVGGAIVGIGERIRGEPRREPRRALRAGVEPT